MKKYIKKLINSIICVFMWVIVFPILLCKEIIPLVYKICINIVPIIIYNIKSKLKPKPKIWNRKYISWSQTNNNYERKM